jgi:GAF domain-containing protein/HAMP domain-containing protein
MTRRFSTLHPLSWPLWVKYLVVFAIGLILLAVPTYTFVRAGVYAVMEQSAQAYVSQVGTRHAAAINESMVQARDLLNTFAANPANTDRVIGYLLRDVRTGSLDYLPRATQQDVADLFRAGLLNPAAALFDSVRLIDRNGNGLINVSVADTSFNRSDETLSAAYLAIRGAQVQAQSTAFAISSGTAPVAELVTTVYWRDGTPLGYVAATMNNGRVFFNNMRTDAPSYSAYSFLTNAQGVLIAPPGARSRAVAANTSDAVTRSLNGQSGVDTYSAKDRQLYVGYYTPLGGTPLVLVTQAPESAVEASAQSFFQVRAFSVAVGLGVLLVLLALLLHQLTAPPLRRLRAAAKALSDGDFSFAVPDARRGDEIGLLASSFVNMRDQVRALIDDLETRVAERTRDITATQDISRFAATQRDLQTLMDRVVDLIVERFPNIYHAQIFLIDADGRDAVLRASTGEVGRQLLTRGHRLGIGSLSVIGQVTQQGRLIVARDAAISQIHRRNEFLPETRAELAIPLRVGERVIGALDVQSRIRDAFEEDQITVLQTMADQIAVAIENVLLYEESMRRIGEIEAERRDATRRAWREFARDQRMEAITREAGFSTPLDASPLRDSALARGEPVIGALTDRDTIPIAIPVMLRGQVLGTVEWEVTAASLSEEKLELAKELANRLALSLDNARLFQESQRATERERLVNDIAAKLTAQTTINDILQTAVREVGQALRAPQVNIRLRGSGSGTNGNSADFDPAGHTNGTSNGSGSQVSG